MLAEPLEPRLVRVVLLAAAILHQDGERPDHSNHRVLIGQYRLDAVDSRVWHIDTALSDLGDDALDDLDLNGSVAVGTAVFVRSLAAGR